MDRRKVAAGLLTALVAVLSIVLLWQVASDVTSQGPARPQAQTRSSDASGILGCREFGRIMSDINAGVLTTPEFRAKVQDMRERYTRLSSTPAIRDNADAVLRAATSGTSEEGAQAALAMIEGCRSINAW